MPSQSRQPQATTMRTSNVLLFNTYVKESSTESLQTPALPSRIYTGHVKSYSRQRSLVSTGIAEEQHVCPGSLYSYQFSIQSAWLDSISPYPLVRAHSLVLSDEGWRGGQPEFFYRPE